MFRHHPQHLDTPRTITDTNGTVVWQWDSTDPFGANMPNENPSGAGQFSFNLRFAGQYYDRETGLNYNVNRDYSPGLGRYIESDPIGLEGGVNAYIYVGDNPVYFVDPLGLFGAGGPGAPYFGHADFSGGHYFNYNLEDTDPVTNPIDGDPERHFRDLPKSESDVANAIASCDRDAFQRAMHRGQDYFSHYSKGFRWKPGSWNRCFGIGHACPLVDPAATDRDKSAWKKAETWSQNRLNKWNKKCGCAK